MGKKKLPKENCVPEYVVERFARCVLDDIRADYDREDIRAEFEAWMAKRERGKGGDCRETRGRSRPCAMPKEGTP